MRFALFLLAAIPVSAQTGTLAGFDFQVGQVFAWGDGAYHWETVNRKPLRIADGTFSAGGCAWDVDGDGKLDLVVNETKPEPALVWYQAPDWKRRVISRGVDSQDMIPAELLGHRGILLIHKRMQVRFFDAPKLPDGEWTETELYSFYTPSHEGGLVLADIDGDGHMDVLAGNYWMQSPTRWELPWHLFAIDTWTEFAESAQLSLLWTGTNRIAAQRAAVPARLAWFEPAPDRKQLWPQHALVPELQLESVSLAALGNDRFIAAERTGRGRILLFEKDWSYRTIGAGRPLLGVRSLGAGKLLVIRRNGMEVVTIQ